MVRRGEIAFSFLSPFPFLSYFSPVWGEEKVKRVSLPPPFFFFFFPFFFRVSGGLRKGSV